jgi:hypothetical protein
MFTLIICAIILLPQSIATLRSVGPAIHLSLLLLSLCAGTAILTALAMHNLPSTTSDQDEVYYVVHISPFGFAAIILCLVMPLYWIVDHFVASPHLRTDAILSQGIALSSAASLAAPAGSPFRMIEVGAVILLLVMLVRGTWHLLRLRTLH